jgi:hypothetical protein
LVFWKIPHTELWIEYSFSSVEPLNRVMTEFIKLLNPSNELVAYKVQTTAPKRYCVRPNAGIIKPGEQIEVQGLK